MFARERHEPKNVLVVEDSADDVELLLIAARTAPDVVSFHMVKDGEQALAYLKGEGQFADRKAHPLPHLVLLDLSLPGMDGLDRKSTRLNSSHLGISYAVFCLKK